MTIILSDKKCVACEGGTLPLNSEEIQDFQLQLKAPWEVIDEKKIRREFKFKDFKEAMAFVNQVAAIAESEGHHPDLFIFYNQVKIELWTHAVNGLSENDFIVAAKIEKLCPNS